MQKLIKIFDRFKLSILFFLAVLGPGIITAVADNDAGGIATYTVAAANYGMSSQVLVIPITFVLAVTQDIGSRIAIVTRKGLGGLIRERFGLQVSMIIFGLYFITNTGVVLQNVSGLKAAFQLFQLPWQPFLILTCALLIYVVVSFNYKKLQRVFMIMILFYVAYIVSALLAHPDWKVALYHGLVFPEKKFITDPGFWFSSIAVLGTTITAWGQFFISSFILDKNLTPVHLNSERTEIVFGAFITNFFSWMVAVAVTFTIYVNRIIVTDGYSAALAMTPFAGAMSTILFSTGLLGASILGLTIVPLATAYVFSEMFGYEGSLDADFKKGRLFYTFFIVQIVLALLVTLFPQTSLFKLTLYVDFLNGAMIPIILVFLYRISTDREIMGKYVISGLSKLVLILAMVVIGAAVIIAIVGKFLHL